MPASRRRRETLAAPVVGRRPPWRLAAQPPLLARRHGAARRRHARRLERGVGGGGEAGEHGGWSCSASGRGQSGRQEQPPANEHVESFSSRAYQRMRPLRPSSAPRAQPTKAQVS